MTVTTRDKTSTVGELQRALVSNALAGELEGFTAAEQESAAQFLAEVASARMPDELAICLESTGVTLGRRRMRLAIVNDDMPFLVDSVANAIAARHLTIYRLLHPVICVRRDGGGKLQNVELRCDDPKRRESMMYIELDRTHARGRRELVEELRAVLADVRAAVRDWKSMQQKMRDDAAAVGDPEGAALLNWFADGAMTLLGYHVEKVGEEPSEALGIFSIPGLPTDKGGAEGAIRYFEEGGEVPLLAKAERLSTVHRRVPLDLVAVPIRKGGKVSAIGVHAGLWTSQALILPTEEVPILRKRLLELDKTFGFDPTGHSGKALRHAVASVPRDLLINLSEDSGRELITMAMSLADRPRPAILLLRSILGGHLFAFVWLPREELNTRRRTDIGRMLEEATGRPVSSWSVELGEGDLALLRYMLDIESDDPTPDVKLLDRRLDSMVRGWRPSVEEALADRVGTGRATRLTLTHAPNFPESYRLHTGPEDAAEDVLRLDRLTSDGTRDARFYRELSADGEHLRLKIYRRGGLIPLSEAVPVLENFGFRVLEEVPTELENSDGAHIHDFMLELPIGASIDSVLEIAPMLERAVIDVLGGVAENDAFNQLVLSAGLDMQPVVWLRAWFRYLRQTGVAFGLATVVDALRLAPAATMALVDLFQALHDPSRSKNRDEAVELAAATFDEALKDVRGIDDDRILRLMRAVVGATLRTNAFAPAAAEALAFKIDSKQVPGLPAPIPYREIWVYSPRVEGIHLRGGPIARGGLRWSDRRDDFRTEILGLMKAQLVKNAVIVPTGAKGGFYAKQLPSPSVDRDGWLAEGTESYRIFIRSLLSVTDNIVEDKVVHPDRVVIRDGEDPYFVVAADKGTATFSDVANAIALERNFWLGDAFASGGSNGYDHKAMGITAKGAWISVQRHFLEMGIDVQHDPVRVAGCGDMSGDVFGNGMLLSQAIKLVAAFDHRHIFIDPNPDPAGSWSERERMFNLPRSSWDDYDRKLLSKGGMIVPRSQKSIDLTPEAKAALGLDVDTIDPSSLISAILKAPVDLLWFGGIGTYIKASYQTNAQVGDPANDSLRVDAREVRAKVIGEGANLAINQAARIEFAAHGGRINTDFIDNSAGVDCSDNEVNIKIPLNREMREGRLDAAERNKLLARMTEEVSELVLEDNRLQSLAISVAEARGSAGLPGFVRTIELLEASGRLDRKVEGLESSDALLRRALDSRGLTRPELAVLLSMSKMMLQDAAEELKLADDPSLEGELMAAFPQPMQQKHADAIRAHRLRHQIVATKVANRLVNRLGPSVALDMTEEEGAGLPQVVTAFLVTERLLGLKQLWARIEAAEVPESTRIELFARTARSVRNHLGDVIRAAAGETSVTKVAALLQPGLDKVASKATRLLRAEVRDEAAARRENLEALTSDQQIVDALVRLYELDGVFGISALSAAKNADALALTSAYTRLGEVLGIDWAHQQVARFVPADQWERLLQAGLMRDFEQLRIDFLSRMRGDDPEQSVENWVLRNPRRMAQFRGLVERAKMAGQVTAPMLAQIASQARILLSR
ncbi:NAD-glutamate dehydrogenase [Sphingomonas xanthus]|uniref:NAD-glutamate dehydrogenase n=1 Tax=Sphingomonas xanthus TaxID=2594473 RepID=A0A516ISA5_9SPHN|nr:NAD-glutamate dehydrogenase domain-containing protein [Sphingomonas xanthus]QDP19776.1 NAD-glutamate dehydrogenase [Sphingomonas xanthus]